MDCYNLLSMYHQFLSSHVFRLLTISVIDFILKKSTIPIKYAFPLSISVDESILRRQVKRHPLYLSTTRHVPWLFDLDFVLNLEFSLWSFTLLGYFYCMYLIIFFIFSYIKIALGCLNKSYLRIFQTIVLLPLLIRDF